jgi:hypothetical protein
MGEAEVKLTAADVNEIIDIRMLETTGEIGTFFGALLPGLIPGHVAEAGAKIVTALQEISLWALEKGELGVAEFASAIASGLGSRVEIPRRGGEG